MKYGICRICGKVTSIVDHACRPSAEPAPQALDPLALMEEYRSAIEGHAAHHNAGSYQTLKYAEEKMARALASSPPQAATAATIEFPSNPPFNILNRPLTWLHTHCRAIGMEEKSEPRTAEGDICLFTMSLKARAEKAEAAAPPQEPAAPANLHRDQAWLEIQGAMEDSMLNDGQKVAFISSILKGVLANPPKLGGYNG